MGWQADLLPAAGLAGAFLLLLVVAETWTRLWHPAPERSRKLVHVVGGLICLSFPWVLTSSWTVAALAVGLTVIFIAGRRFGWLSCLHGVGRKSRGAEYYPAMIFVLFVLAHNRPWLYAAALLTLAVADALAALIGRRYGQLHYEVDDESKTVEGSLTFFLAALGAISIPLLLSDEPDLPSRMQRLPMAAVTAVLVTLFEAISRRGRDNLWVPLGTYLVLARMTSAPVATASYQLASLAATCIVVGLVVAVSSSVNVGATLALILAVYGTWALASFDWALPMLGGIALCSAFAFWLPPRQPLRAGAMLNMMLPIMLAVAGAELSAIAGRDSLAPVLFAAFLGGCQVVVVQNLWHSVIRLRRRSMPAAMAWCAGIAAAVTAALCWPLCWQEVGMTLGWVVILMTVAVIVCATHDSLFAGRAPRTQRWPYVLRRYLITSAAMIACGAAAVSGFMPLLTPN